MAAHIAFRENKQNKTVVSHRQLFVVVQFSGLL